MSLREPTLFTLAALREGPLHGYAIAARARELSAGRVSLTAGTLYGALDRLVEQGLVEVDREEVVEGRKRRYHRLTEAGGHAVEEELGRLEATLSALSTARPTRKGAAGARSSRLRGVAADGGLA
ncbi:MAG: PadR family transcriptional regulator [Solirubrobacteraceae bacterium]|nr:PadR family transcriptional regulator [Patulibacter sp.]